MSTTSVTLANALQNSDVIGQLITKVRSGDDFALWDADITTAPYACIAVSDLIRQETSYVGSSGGRIAGQLEVRCISTISRASVQALAELVKTQIWASINATKISPISDKDENMRSWHEILTVDYKN
jgi:hypothetical protein